MIWFLPQPRASEGKRSEPLKAHQCLNQSITSTEKKNYIYFSSIFYASTSQSQRGVSCGSRFSTECVTSSCNVSTSKRSRWVEEMQCETPWAEWELMKAWCKFCVASRPVFYTTTVQQSWKAPQEGNMKPTKPNPPIFLKTFVCHSSLFAPALVYLPPVLLRFCQSFFPAGLVCVSDPCHLTPGLIRPVSQVSTFPACSLCPGAHRLACSSCST